MAVYILSSYAKIYWDYFAIRTVSTFVHL